MRTNRRFFAPLVLLISLVIVAGGAPPAAAAPEGQITWAVHVSLAPTWFDPAETSGIITPYLLLYALHDAVVKPMPGNPMAPSLAESWSVSPDGLVYEFVGVHAKLRPLERAAFFKGYSDKKHRGLIQGASGAFGNAATRIEAFVAGGGTYAYGSYPDIDGLFREQAAEVDQKKREAS